METCRTIAESIRNVAAILGFSSCGIACARQSCYTDEFQNWLDSGMHGQMEWLARSPERRCDPRLVLPGCNSVVMLAYDYGNDWQGCLADHMGRYAWGRDYHPILQGKLSDLDDLMQIYGGSQKCYVDTGPVMETAWAVNAGLGWKGRNGLVVRRQGGSCFFLASILTTLQLPADEPVASRCGRCRRCQQNCPTGALMDGAIDASRCVSYLTIEHKGSIPEDLRPLMGVKIYGCDECQKSCPWNRKPQRGADSLFKPPARLRSMTLADFAGMTEEDFIDAFRHSPVRRIKRERLLRNVCVAMGNTGMACYLKTLERLSRTSELIREHAEWAIVRIHETQGK